MYKVQMGDKPESGGRNEKNMKIDVLGVEFDDIAAKQAVMHACEIINSGGKAYIVTPNPEIIWMARHDGALLSAVNGAGLVLSDGIGVIMCARILGTPLRCGRVPGIDFAEALFEKMAQAGGRVFLLGAKPGVAELAGNQLMEKYPGLDIAGAADGYFTDDEPVVEKINSAHPDLLLVCLGSPKQELWMAENLGRLRVKLCAGLGGSLDVFAGNVKRAPAFFRKFGMEWLYRLLCEPSRIKRMIKLPLFVLAVVWKRLRRRPAG